jgi:meiotically up-regulated gene 157 (Mug157) protein
MARALLKWGPDHADLVRQHLLWLFEIAERDAGLWGRAYLANGRIKDRAFQLDQQIYPLLELADYFAATGDTTTLTRLQHHIAAVVEALLAKRAHYDWLFATDETPADDPVTHPYHLSSHILLWHTLRQLAALGPHLGVDLEALAGFAAAVHEATQRTFRGQRGGVECYAYAADGYGHAGFYHDANDFPLALAPTWGFVAASDPTWRATVDFAFSTANPSGFYSGHLGSVHTPAPWPLGDIQELHIARLLGDTNRVARVRAHLQKAAQWDGALPEAYAAETYSVLSRHWFAWPGAAYAWLELEA